MLLKHRVNNVLRARKNDELDATIEDLRSEAQLFGTSLTRDEQLAALASLRCQFNTTSEQVEQLKTGLVNMQAQLTATLAMRNAQLVFLRL